MRRRVEARGMMQFDEDKNVVAHLAKNQRNETYQVAVNHTVGVEILQAYEDLLCVSLCLVLRHRTCLFNLRWVEWL